MRIEAFARHSLTQSRRKARCSPFVGPIRREPDASSDQPDEAGRCSERFAGYIFRCPPEESAQRFGGWYRRQRSEGRRSGDQQFAEVFAECAREVVRISFL